MTLEELTRLASPLGVRSANVAKLFTAPQLEPCASPRSPSRKPQAAASLSSWPQPRELDVDRVGSLTILGFGFLEVQQSRGEMQSPLPRKAQFEVMSLPNRIFRLSNGESEPDGIQQIMRECLLGLY